MLRHKLEASNADNQHVRLMNVSELEKCLKEALYTDTVGCPESILYDISQATYHPGFLDRILKAIWKCIHSRPSKVRRIQKGLSLLHYLVINGSERCISDILLHMDDINALHKLKFSQANREIGALIKEKAVKLTSLICDTEALHAKRKYTASIRDRFVSVGSNNGKMETDVLHKPVYVVDEGRSTPGPEFVRSQIDVSENRGFLSRFFKGKPKPAVVNVGLYGLPDAHGSKGVLHGSLYPGSASYDAHNDAHYGAQDPQYLHSYIGQYSRSGEDHGRYGHHNEHHDVHYGHHSYHHSGYPLEHPVHTAYRREFGQSYQERRPLHGYSTPARKSSLDSGSTFKKYSSSSSSSDSDSSYDEHIKHGKYVSHGKRSGNRGKHEEPKDVYGDVFDDTPIYSAVMHTPDEHVHYAQGYGQGYSPQNVHHGQPGYAGQYGYGPSSRSMDQYGGYNESYGGRYHHFEPRYASTHQDMPSVHRQYLSRAGGSNPFNRPA